MIVMIKCMDKKKMRGLFPVSLGNLAIKGGESCVSPPKNHETGDDVSVTYYLYISHDSHGALALTFSK